VTGQRPDAAAIARGFIDAMNRRAHEEAAQGRFCDEDR